MSIAHGRLALVAAGWLLACASAPLPAPAPSAGPRVKPAREALDPGWADAVRDHAFDILQARGYAVERGGDVLSAIQGGELELDAPCSDSSCLARETVEVRVGWRSIEISVRREVWDASIKAWIEPEDARALAAIEEEQRVLLDEVLGRRTPRAARRDGAVCEDGRPCTKRIPKPRR